jgi:hypothetical protein
MSIMISLTYCIFAMFQKFDLGAPAGFQLDTPAPR